MQRVLSNMQMHAFWVLITLICACPTLCVAQSADITIEAEISHRRVFVGDPLTYQITVRGVDPGQTPEIDFPPSLNATYRNGGQQTFVTTQIINGQRQTVTNELFTYQYTLTVLQPGTITIPPARVSVGNKTYTSNRVTIDSRYPSHADEDEIVIDLERTSLYVNESVPMTITWWIGNRNTSEFTFDSSIFPDSITITPGQINGRSRQQYNIEIAGQQVIGVLDEPTENGIRKTRMRMRVMLTPTQPGTLTLGPVRVLFNRIESNTRYRAYAESDQVQIEVNPVPEEGKPAGYAGAIGSFSLTSSASNRSVNVGDPIELALRVQGNDPMQGLRTGPDLASDPEFSDAFRVAAEGWREDLPRQPNSRIYRTTIRALESSVRAIPGVKLPAFDPETGEYRIFSSNPIPIDVRAVREVTLADAIGSFSNTTPTDEDDQTEIQPSGSGVWAHAPARSMLANDDFDLRQRLRSPVWITTMALGPMCAGTLMLVGRRRQHQSSDARVRARAWSDAKKLDARGERCNAIRVYLGSIIGCEPDAFSSADLDALAFEDGLRDQIECELFVEEHAEFADAPPVKPHNPCPDLIIQIRNAVRSIRPTNTDGSRS